MQVGKAVVTGASEGPEGAPEVEFEVVCPAANCERLNVVAGAWRVAVALDCHSRGAWRQFKVTAPSHLKEAPVGRSAHPFRTGLPVWPSRSVSSDPHPPAFPSPPASPAGGGFSVAAAWVTGPSGARPVWRRVE